MYGTDPFEKHFGAPVHNGYTHLWTGSLLCSGEDSRTQMAAAFRELERQLRQNGLNVADDTLRTWILVRDVDTNYAGVVEGRKDYFETVGLTPATHFIASTGIEGRAPEWRNLVLMDAYTVGGLREGQKHYLKASDHLSPTAVYGVTFERGTAVTYGDRRQIYISGTASIDARGKIVHPGDPAAQTGRMLENVAALLAEAGAGLSDIAMAIVYLRDPADYPCVRQYLEEACPGLDALYVHAPVCRPAWLVEMECIALTADGDKAFPAF
jgi:enamine deaminase RidA (YjgF/YER057c/UK114 family)